MYIQRQPPTTILTTNSVILKLTLEILQVRDLIHSLKDLNLGQKCWVCGVHYDHGSKIPKCQYTYMLLNKLAYLLPLSQVNRNLNQDNIDIASRS